MNPRVVSARRSTKAIRTFLVPALAAACLAPDGRAHDPSGEAPPAVSAGPSPTSRPLTAAERLTGLSPQRVAAFRKAMADLGGSERASPSLHFLAEYETPRPRLGSESVPALLADDDSMPMSPGLVGRDLWAEEEFLIEGREDDFQDASTKWLARRVKGSDAAATRRAGRFAPKFAWDDGPLAGFRRGSFSVMAGEDQWSLRWSRRMARPGWVARVSCGSEDGEERIAFTIGRSLLHARTAR